MRRQFKPDQTRPPDFDVFWDDTREELERVDPALDCKPDERSEDPDLILEAISFQSLGLARISGYLLRWKDEAPRPLIFHSHGYGSQCEVQWDWARRGATVCGVDIRGHGRSRGALPNPSPWGYVLSGIESPETSVLRGAICDYAQAVRVVSGHLGTNDRRTILQGESFAGALALMAEALLGVADFVAVGVPTFGWATGRHVFTKKGSGAQVNHFLARYPDRFEDVMVVLAYYDLVNFTDRVSCPVVVGVGLEDDAVPAKTVFAAVNHLQGSYEVMEFPVSHSDRPEEQLWEEFDRRWLALAIGGLPPNFGGDAHSSGRSG